LAAFSLLLLLGLTGCFRASEDTKALRDGLLKSAQAESETQVEVAVGAWPLALARVGLAFLDVPPEAGAALSALRRADVSVSELCPRCRLPDRAAMLVSADAVMAERGWDRVVGVIDRGDLVAIYAPRDLRSPRELRFCVAVVDERDLVVASVRGNPEPLFELAWHRAESGLKPHWAKARAPAPHD
jgi:hypothetical protein